MASRLNGHEFEQILGDSEGQRSLVCCHLQSCKESDTATTEQQLVAQTVKNLPILDAWGWCTGTTQRDGMGREEGGGFRMGNTGIPVMDSF